MSESRIHQMLRSSMLLGGGLASLSADLSAAALSYGSPLRSRETELACNRILSSANTAGRVSCFSLMFAKRNQTLKLLKTKMHKLSSSKFLLSVLQGLALL